MHAWAPAPFQAACSSTVVLDDAGWTEPGHSLANHARNAGPTHAGEAVHWSIAAAAEAAGRLAPDSALQWWHAAHEADR